MTEVNITQSTLIGQTAQITADNAASGVINLNDPNLMSVIEKQTAVTQYAGLTSQYNVILARAKDANISTTDLTTAYTNLNAFMASILTDTTKASDVNRETYKSLTDAYNMALSNVQTALKDSFNADIDNMHSSVSVASQAASSAVIVASQAAITGDNANQVASRATVAANDAQSAGNNAISVANNASQAASGAVIAGSTAASNADKAITAASQAQIAGNNATSVANNASQAASGAVIAGSTATVIANKASTVANEAKSAGDNATSVANTATSVANSAKSAADSTYTYANSEIAVQSNATAKAQSKADDAFSKATTAIDTGKVTSQAVTDLKDGSKLTIAELENGLATKVANSEYASYKEQTSNLIAEKVATKDFSTYKTQTTNLIAEKVATKDFTAYQATTSKSIDSKVESKDFNTYKTQTDGEISSKVESSNFQALQTQVDNSAVGTNLLTNSNFSDESLTYWTVDTGVTSSFDSNGNLVLTVVNATANNRIYYSNQILDAGTTYAISFYAYVDSSSTSSSVNVEVGPYDNLTSIAVSGTTLARYTGIIKPVWGNSGALSITVGAFNSGTVGDIVHITKIKLEKGSVATDWSLNPEDQATQSQITQLSGEIDLRVTKGGLVDQINIQAGKTLISSSGQLILSGKSVVLDSVDPVIMKSANIGNMAVGTAQIANGAITNAQIGSLAVDTANIKDAAISSAKIAKLAVGTAQIGDGAITKAKIGKLAVGTAQIANGAITNAKIGSLAVDTANIKDAAINSAKIAKLAVGTAQIGDGAITNAKIGKLAVGTAKIANAAITDAKIGNVSANKLTAGTIDFNTITGKNINASNITTGKLDTDRLNVNKLSALSANLGDVTTGSLKGVDIIANTFSTPNGSFTTDANGNVVARNLTIRGVTNLVYNAALLGGNGSNVPGWNILNNGYYSNQTLHDGVPSIGYHNNTGAGAWVNFAQSKLYSLNGRTGLPYSASVWFLEVGSDTNLKYQFTLAFFDANGNRLDSGSVGNTWNGIGSRQDWRYVTINNAVSPSTAVYVAIQYWAYNGSGYGLFSSPMLTQTAQPTGYQPDTGNVVSAGEIDGSVINGSTINGTTFNGGDIISNANNTAKYYPMTITPDGAYKSTYFDSRVALRASVRSGAIIYDYRSMLPDGNGKYIYSSTTIHGQGITIDSGHTDTKDSTFNGYRTGGSYISLTPSAGLLLHGSDANINFGGHLKDNEFDEGMYMNPYGNIIGKSASDYWQISKQGTDNTGGGPTARFGIDTGGKGTINFYRPLFVDEIGGFTDSNGNALFIHGNDDGKSGSTGQMLFRKDGRSAQVVSTSIYNRTYSGGSTVTVTSHGTLGRITSASKYKLDITKETSISPANKLLSIDMSSWIDKSSAEQLSDSKTNGTDLSEPEMNVFRHYGLIAEDLIKAGLDEFVIKGDNGQAEGIEYDRLWTVLIPKIRQLSNDQIQNKMTIAKLGSEIEELKQGR
ncbi:beta strand repeat-containing protein [Lactiplantibacillus pentosus]